MTESSQIECVRGGDSPPQKVEIFIRSSDFSIDHILNKAGNTNNVMMQQTIGRNFPNFNSKNLNAVFLRSETTNFTPILDWLHYTRYHPPRLPRPTKNGPVKRTLGRLPRIPFTPYQLSELESAYQKANYMSSEDASKLAVKLDLTCTRVKIWFQNRRARERREGREASQKTISPAPFQCNFSKSCQ